MSDEWFDSAAMAFGRVELPEHDLTVQYTCVDGADTVVHHQVFRGGRLTRWAGGPTEEADLVLLQPLSINLAMLTRVSLGNGLLAETRVVVDGRFDAPCVPPPLDEVLEPWGAKLPMVPTAAELVVVQVLTGSPFGTVSTVHHVVQGRVVESRLGSSDTADVVATRAYPDAMAERAGDLDVLESIRHGDVVGSFLSVGLFLGIYDSDECRESRMSLTSPAMAPLAILGSLLESPGWRSTCKRLIGLSDDMRSIP